MNNNKKIKIKIVELNKEFEYPKGIKLQDLANEFSYLCKSKIMAAYVNNDIRELFRSINHDGEIKFIDLSCEDGVRIYQRGLIFTLYVAAKELFKNRRLRVLHSLGRGLYCDFKGNGKILPQEVEQLKAKMKGIIEKDLEYHKKEIYKFDAISMFEKDGRSDKAELLKFRRKSTINIYFLENYFNYFYGYMPGRTSDTPIFDLIPYRKGMVLVTPYFTDVKEPSIFKPQEKLADIYDEVEEWRGIIGVETVGDLNEIIASGKSKELILVSEMLHEKKIAYLADEIASKKHAKLVLIAGPSSSGKTTFSKRLALQLRVNGYDPKPISLDNYFVERGKTPLDSEGKPNFECLEALNLERFNEDLNKILKGETTQLPRFNFKNGKSESDGEIISPIEKTILIVEGIHALNPSLTPYIISDLKFKVYVSALTHISLDYDNRIPTTDVRILRRMVRDNSFRGRDAITTLREWHSVRVGEEKNIFPYQEKADAMFNSSLTYELAVLKNFAEPLLLQIDNSAPEYSAARRLIRFLDYFLPIIDFDIIPATSILKEFIGKSIFEV